MMRANAFRRYWSGRDLWENDATDWIDGIRDIRGDFRVLGIG